MKLLSKQRLLAFSYFLSLSPKYPLLESTERILFTQYQRPSLKPHAKKANNSEYFNFVFVSYTTERLNILN
jgi:hypothetical protein